jgi:hypothetical protein
MKVIRLIMIQLMDIVMVMNNLLLTVYIMPLDLIIVVIVKMLDFNVNTMKT